MAALLFFIEDYGFPNLCLQVYILIHITSHYFFYTAFSYVNTNNAGWASRDNFIECPWPLMNYTVHLYIIQLICTFCWTLKNMKPVYPCHQNKTI